MNEQTCCDVCGERFRGLSYLKDGRLLCGLCLDDELNSEKRDERKTDSVETGQES